MTAHIAAVPAKARFHAWRCILDAVADQREALDHRIRLENPDDDFLETDCRTWCEIAHGLADFLEARRRA